MNKNRKIIAIIGGLAVIAAGLIWLVKPGTRAEKPSGNLAETTTVSSQLVSEENSFNFGEISMAKGKVSHIFRVRNDSAGQVIVEKIYTSCMCTAASMVLGEERFGPYGMPGHGFVPKANVGLAAGQEAEIEVVFDPAAHGPAGVGRIERMVYLENDSGILLELKISAMVTP